MKKTLLGYFGPFFNYKFNSSKDFVLDVEESKNLTKKEFSVGYFKKEFLNKIKGDYERIILLGMNGYIKEPQFETIARNQIIKLKNPIFRFFGDIYFYILKLIGLNPKTKIKEKTLIKLYKKYFKEFPIEKNSEDIKLKTKVPKIFRTSKDAGGYACNYIMWVIEKYLRENHLKTKFYFIHLPKKLEEQDKNKLEKFIFNS